METCVSLSDMFYKSMGNDIAVDLGTANTLVSVRGKGIVLIEPSVVAIEQDSGRVLAVGKEAKRMIGRTPGSIVATRPLKDGVIANFNVTEAMLRYFINQVRERKFLFQPKPRVVICVPSGVTEVEKRAVFEAAMTAGARHAFLIEEPMAAAIGAGLPIQDPTGSMVIDIGGGTTEIAVISLGGIVVSTSLRIAGDEFDEAIVDYVRRAYNVLIGERTAEEIKFEIGSAFPLDEEVDVEIRGRNLTTGLPVTVTMESEEIREALEGPTSAIIDAMKRTLEKTPPELSSDLMEFGVVLTGGGALLRGLDERLKSETKMPVYVSESALINVVNGSAQALEEIDVLKKVLQGAH
jgi:rod shape-determining protein MreB